MRISGIALSAIALACFVLTGQAKTLEEAEAAKTCEAPLRLAVFLSDGSRIVGVPAVGTIRVHAVFGGTEVPLAHIASITFGDDNERVIINMANGDRLSGVHDLSELKLTTLFGDIEISAFHIRKIESEKTVMPDIEKE